MGRGRGWEPFGNREIASWWAVISVGHEINISDQLMKLMTPPTKSLLIFNKEIICNNFIETVVSVSKNSWVFNQDNLIGN
jgi:hypothetical protein